MPLIARSHIKIGLIYFAMALIMGVIMAAQPVLNLSPSVNVLRPVFLHFLMVGWVTQIIMGVAHWMFPKLSKEKPRGNTRIGWMVFGLLNIGLILRLVSEPMMAVQPANVWALLLAVAAIFQVAAGWLFIANIWGRVKER